MAGKNKKDELYVQGLCQRGEWEKEAREWKKKAIKGANKEGGQKEQELGERRREMERRIWRVGKSTKVGRESEKGAQEDERQKADRAEEIPGQNGRVEG